MTGAQAHLVYQKSRKAHFPNLQRSGFGGGGNVKAGTR